MCPFKFSGEFITYDLGNGVFGASQWVPVDLDVYGNPYPNGGYYRSLGSYMGQQAAEAACSRQQ